MMKKLFFKIFVSAYSFPSKAVSMKLKNTILLKNSLPICAKK
jgi:hypothetical protein